MDLGFQMIQEQAQKLVMTTQMREALSVLEMSGDELHEYVVSRAEQNVFMEVGLSSVRPSRRNPGGHSEWGPALENRCVVEWTLVDEVKQQLRLQEWESSEHLGEALRLADDLDVNGYLEPFNEEIARRLVLTEASYDRAVTRIQCCEPGGIGARNLRECLLLQLHRIAPDYRQLVGAIVDGHLDDIALGRMSQVARILKVSTDDVLAGLAEIRTLNPRPGTAFGAPRTHYIRPDLNLVKIDDGYAVVVPNVLTDMEWQNHSYRQMMRSASTEVRHYLLEQWREARWIRRCVTQRAMTLHRIGDAIAILQPDFLNSGFEHLRPMRLRDVADVVGVHESTVSRAIRNKTLATPVGLVPLRQLFSATLHSAGGDVSAAAIKHQMKEWLRNEPGDEPLTDAVISTRFSETGIKVSRRTVAKYREAMGIPSSAARRIQARPG